MLPNDFYIYQFESVTAVLAAIFFHRVAICQRRQADCSPYMSWAVDSWFIQCHFAFKRHTQCAYTELSTITIISHWMTQLNAKYINKKIKKSPAQPIHRGILCEKDILCISSSNFLHMEENTTYHFDVSQVGKLRFRVTVCHSVSLRMLFIRAKTQNRLNHDLPNYQTGS